MFVQSPGGVVLVRNSHKLNPAEQVLLASDVKYPLRYYRAGMAPLLLIITVVIALTAIATLTEGMTVAFFAIMLGALIVFGGWFCYFGYLAAMHWYRVRKVWPSKGITLEPVTT